MKKILTTIFTAFAFISLHAKDFSYLDQDQLCKAPFTDNAILRQEPLFVDDFLTIHSLIQIVKPISLFEIGTCSGEGTLIIKNAMGDGVVYSLDLPPDETTYDIPKVGGRCYLPYVQIIGNSLTVDYTQYYPIDSWFIDGSHDYSHVLYETGQALQSSPKIIIWHDADIPEVFQAIKDGLDANPNYNLFRVLNTRIAFSVPSVSNLNEVLND